MHRTISTQLEVHKVDWECMGNILRLLNFVYSRPAGLIFIEQPGSCKMQRLTLEGGDVWSGIQ